MKPLVFGSFWVATLLIISAAPVRGGNLELSQRLGREHLQATHDARAQFARERIAVTNLHPRIRFQRIGDTQVHPVT